MKLSLNIYDTLNSSHVLQDKIAAYNSMVLNYSGSDNRDQNMIGSQLNFSIYDETNQQASYNDLFTAVESQYLVELFNDDTNAVVWAGYLLPETYNEVDGSSFVGFAATDGLGLLKGKYFESSIYNYEYSVIDVISRILRATGLELSLMFSPAITNHLQKDWDTIYVDLEHYKSADSGNDTDLYTILTELLSAMCCTLYQSEGYWFLVGLNKRQLSTVTCSLYNHLGELLNADYVYNRISKNYVFSKGYTASIIPALGSVSLDWEKEALTLPKTLYKEVLGAVSLTASDAFYAASEWQSYQADFVALADVQDDRVFVPFIDVDANRYISLKNPLYVPAGKRIRLTMDFELYANTDWLKSDNDTDTTQTNIQYLISNQSLLDVLPYQVTLAGELLFSNADASVDILEDYKAEKINGLENAVVFDFLVQTGGYLDIKFFNLTYINEYLYGLKITNLTLEDKSEVVNTAYKQLQESYSSNASYDLPITVDVSTQQKSFLLSKQKQFVETELYTYGLTLLYSFKFRNQNYAQFSLYDLSVIKNNADQIYVNGERLTSVELLFNFNTGEQMVMLTDDLLTESDVLTVKIYNSVTDVAERVDWENFTDDVYPISLDNYNEVVLSVYERLFKSTAIGVEGLILGVLSFNHLVTLDYDGFKTFYPLNMSWNIFTGKTTVVLCQDVYNGYSGVVDVPAVEAGNDLSVSSPIETLQLSAVVQSDLDYTILWEDVTELDGSAVVITNAETLTPTLTSWQVTETIVQVTVTNSAGISATDQLTVTYVGQVAPVLNTTASEFHFDEYVTFFDDTDQENTVLVSVSSVKKSDKQIWTYLRKYHKNTYGLVFDDLGVDTALNITFNLFFKVSHLMGYAGFDDTPETNLPMINLKVYKNGNYIREEGLLRNGTDNDAGVTIDLFRGFVSSPTSGNRDYLSNDFERNLNIVLSATAADVFEFELEYVGNDVVRVGESDFTRLYDAFFTTSDIVLSIVSVSVLSGIADVSNLVGTEILTINHEASYLGGVEE